MKWASKKTSALNQYLEPFLATGTDEDIAKAKERYWKEYRKQYNKTKYKDATCFKILLTPAELSVVKNAAKHYRTSPTGFIKTAAFTQASKGAFIDKATIAKVREVLVLHYSAIETLLEEHEQAQVLSDDILQLTAQLQDTILHILTK